MFCTTQSAITILLEGTRTQHIKDIYSIARRGDWQTARMAWSVTRSRCVES